MQKNEKSRNGVVFLKILLGFHILMSIFSLSMTIYHFEGVLSLLLGVVAVFHLPDFYITLTLTDNKNSTTIIGVILNE